MKGGNGEFNPFLDIRSFYFHVGNFSRVEFVCVVRNCPTGKWKIIKKKKNELRYIQVVKLVGKPNKKTKKEFEMEFFVDYYQTSQTLLRQLRQLRFCERVTLCCCLPLFGAIIFICEMFCRSFAERNCEKRWAILETVLIQGSRRCLSLGSVQQQQQQRPHGYYVQHIMQWKENKK